LIVPLLSTLLLAQDPAEKPEAFTFLFWTDRSSTPARKAS
jgi:hypothetical protein